MDAIASGLGIYIFLLVLFRLTGNRVLAQITTFDAVLILIIAEAIQEAMIGSDQSMTNAALLIVTLLGFDVLLSVATVRSRFLERLINDLPILLVDNGVLLQERMKKVRVSEDDVLENARSGFGIERLDQVKYAILERNGNITIIPREVGWAMPPAEPAPEDQLRSGAG
jgi:uncharacterized membrane protein YcaP (DUF421 family)